MGRFASTDPVGYEENVNLFCYSRCSPAVYTDSTGKGIWSKYPTWLDRDLSAEAIQELIDRETDPIRRKELGTAKKIKEQTKRLKDKIRGGGRRGGGRLGGGAAGGAILIVLAYPGTCYAPQPDFRPCNCSCRITTDTLEQTWFQKYIGNPFGDNMISRTVTTEVENLGEMTVTQCYMRGSFEETEWVSGDHYFTRTTSKVCRCLAVVDERNGDEANTDSDGNAIAESGSTP